jgi:serine/threonine-protein kinase CHEK2
MIDKNLTVKLADFGLAKIIGEESFTTTLCGTPSYVAPEILEDSTHRRYTRAVDVWSLGVVLYICLCGFPPFSDELYSKDNPYTLTQQIKLGKFDYPSPYWDSVGDPALDLIDHMLTVDINKRYTIDQCLEHPWLTGQGINVNDSTDGLVGGLAGLDFMRRKIARERTLLSSMNDVKISRLIEVQPDKEPVKVYVKNPNSKQAHNKANVFPKVKAGSVESPPTPTKSSSKSDSKKSKTKKPKESSPSTNRNPQEFMEMGGKGDQVLFNEVANGQSVYSTDPSSSENTLKTATG